MKRLLFYVLLAAVLAGECVAMHIALLAQAEDKKKVYVAPTTVDSVEGAYPNLGRQYSADAVEGKEYTSKPVDVQGIATPVLRVDMDGKLVVKCGEITAEAVLSCDSIHHQWVEGPTLLTTTTVIFNKQDVGNITIETERCNICGVLRITNP